MLKKTKKKFVLRKKIQSFRKVKYLKASQVSLLRFNIVRVEQFTVSFTVNNNVEKEDLTKRNRRQASHNQS